MNRYIPASLAIFAATSIGHAALTDNLVAYWDFEGNMNNNAAASGGVAYNGTTPTTTAGNTATTSGTPRVGTGALSVDGNGDYMNAATMVDANQPWSVSAWYLADVAPSGSTRMFVFESNSYAMSMGLREGSPTTNTSHQAFTDITPGADVSYQHQIADTVSAGTWHHVVLAFTPPTSTVAGSIVYYFDGSPVTTMMVAVGNTLVPATSFKIGTYRNADGRWFDGSIDEVAIWNRTLRAAEAGSVYQIGSRGEALTTVNFTIALTAIPTAGGAVSGGGTYANGASASIAATPNPGFVFSDWSGPFTGQPAEFNHTVTADVTATATFGPDTADTDGDGLTNYDEVVIYQTQVDDDDTDNDGMPDGVEVNQTGTSPTQDDSLLVDYVRANLSPASAGAIALATPVIERDPVTGALTLKVAFHGSADQRTWSAIPLSGPEVSITADGNFLNVTLPAPSASVDSYILLGSRP